MKKIYIASDHAGYNLKEVVIKKFSKKLNLQDLGVYKSKKSVNYSDFAHKLCRKVIKKKSNIGILICGSGMGMTMAANKHKKIRAALCYSVRNTKTSSKRNQQWFMAFIWRLWKYNQYDKHIQNH